MSEIQRLRLLAAMAEVASERGAGAVTVAHVVARAGVSRRTFYDLFEDREECFLAAFEEAVAWASEGVLAAYETGGAWRERVRAGLTALLWFFDDEPALARLCVVEALAAGPRALARRAEVLAVLVAAVDEGREGSRRGAGPPPLTADGVVGAVLSVIHTQLLQQDSRRGAGAGGGRVAGAGRVGGLVELLGSLMSMIVLPYEGAAVARRELARPAPGVRREARHSRADPLEGLDMRITYRTVRVLMVVGSDPGASNRRIATEAGISDQGQVSKLLARLENLGLIHNTGIGHTKGASNAWTLTPRGSEVEQAIRVQTTPR